RPAHRVVHRSRRFREAAQEVRAARIDRGGLMVARIERRPAPDAAPAGPAWLALRRMASTAICALSAMGRSRLQMISPPERARPRRRAELLSEASARVLEAHGIEIVVAGACAPEPAILVANHLGYLDPLVVASLVHCAPIAKSELAGWPLLGSAARDVGAI